MLPNISNAEVKEVIKHRVGHKIDRENGWLKGVNAVFFVVFCVATLITAIGYGAVTDWGSRDQNRENLSYTLSNNTFSDIYTDGKYLMIGDAVYAEQVYLTPEGDMLYINNGNLVDKQNNLVAVNNDKNKLLYQIPVGVSLGLVFIWFLIYFWWLDKRLTVTTKYYHKWIKEGELPTELTPEPEND